MKVYVITRDKHPVAISEDISEIRLFWMQNNLSPCDYKIHELHGELAETVILVYDEIILEEYDWGIVRVADINGIEDMIDTIHQQMQDSIEILANISDYLVVDSIKSRNLCAKCANYIEKNISNINIRGIINDYYRSADLRYDDVFTHIDIDV